MLDVMGGWELELNVRFCFRGLEGPYRISDFILRFRKILFYGVARKIFGTSGYLISLSQ